MASGASCIKCNEVRLYLHAMQLSSIDLNLLVLLDALLETRSVKLAAAKVALSPSAASHALGRLRTLLGDPILVRAGRQMVPTARAERIRSEIRRVLGELSTLLTLGQPIDPKTLERSFRAAANDYAEAIVIRPLSDALAREAPRVDLYTQTLGADTVERLRAGDVDLALGVFADYPSDLRGDPLLREHFICLLRRGHPALSHDLTPQSYARLAHVLVAPRGQPRGIVDVYLERQGLTRRVARTVASFEAAPALVANTDYVVTLPARVAHRLGPALELALVSPPLELPGFDLSLVWHQRHDEEPSHRWLREQVKSACR